MKFRLGALIEQVSIRCGIKNHKNISGINIQKRFMHSNNSGSDTSKYKIVEHNQFACNLMHVGRDGKIPIAINADNEEIVVSPAYNVFEVTNNQVVDVHYLNMVFTSTEFDRYAWFCTDASIRGNLDWERFLDIEIDLPPLHIQEKYVAIYKAMLANQKAYENGLEDLKLICDVELDTFKKTSQLEYIGNLFSEVDKRNTENQLSKVLGININKEFMPSKSTSEKLERYKIIEKDHFAYSSMQTGRDEVIRIALYSKDEPALVSPAYSILITKENVLPEYIMMWFSRKEVDRLGWFLSDSSIRANLDLKRFYEIQIPVPDINIQQSIVDIYNAYITRKEINERLKQQIKEICPILIAGAIKEANSNA
ncbi:restriction endonuclease subunit S [Streptococcus uberis]|uniref:restriction endonuclease subunit S n=1 Tax=Streptococcus uberis TaxID=1349 RepID=UPI00193A8F83|nr:restriction endonuclease subunit S [Streptococcus uberis]MCK1215204.1 restriction endonuclease subunit S [Streptococcus uberis]